MTLLEVITLLTLSLVPGLSVLVYGVVVRWRSSWVLPILGGGGWLIALLLRAPLLYLLLNNVEESTYLIIASYAAGIFEESIRYVILRSPVVRNPRVGDAIVLGLGWGVTEALFIYVIPILIYLYNNYNILELLPGAIERNIAVVAHLIFSVLVMVSVSNVKYLLIAIITHGTLNIAGITILKITGNAWVTEASLAIIVAVLALATAIMIKRHQQR